MISTDTLYLFLYMIAWLVVFFIYYRKKATFGAGNFIILTYLIYSIASILLNSFYNDGEYGGLTLFPFLYLFIMLLISLQPVLKHNEKCTIQHPSENIIDLFAWTYVISSIVVLPDIILKLQEGIVYILTVESGAEELYLSNRMRVVQTTTFGIYNLFASFYNVFSDFSIFLVFYYLSLKNKKKKTLLYGLLIANIAFILSPIANGSRTEGTLKLLTIVSAYFLMKENLDAKSKKYIRLIGAIFLGFIAIVMMATTISRFKYAEGTDTSIVRYIGQANINFNKYGLDAGGIRNGDRTCNQFKKLLGFDNVPKDIIETRTRYAKMKFSDAGFTTFVGDFTLDFGPTIAAIILITVSLILVKLTKHKKGSQVLFHQLILIYFSMCVCVQGGMYLFYYSFLRNYNIIGFILIYWLFYWDYHFNFKKEINISMK